MIYTRKCFSNYHDDDEDDVIENSVNSNEFTVMLSIQMV